MDDYLVRMPRDSETYSGSAVLRFHDPRSERLRPMRVFAYFPEAVRTGKQTSVLFVMHGVHRNAEEMFQQIVPPDKSCSRDPLVNKRLLPELHNFVLLLPEFSAALFPERNAYNFGNVFRNAGDLPDTKSPHSEAEWSFTAIERIYEAVKVAAALNTEGYVLWGHSAGAQFVHRLIAVKSNDREMLSGTRHLLRAVAANAGSYTMPSFQEEYPFGFGGLSSIGITSIASFLHAPLLVLLGLADTDPFHKTIPTDRQAQQQGINRLQRGLSFYSSGLEYAREHRTFFDWQLALVPGVAHNGILMLEHYLKHYWVDTYQPRMHVVTK